MELVDYNRPPFIQSTFPGSTDIIDNILRLTRRENVYGGKRNNNSLPMFLQTEQKSDTLIKTLVKMYTHSDELVFRPFAASYSTRCAYMLLPEHCKCTIEDKEPDCENHAIVQLMELFTHQIESS